MKKGIFIVAGVLLVGGVAYLFLKNKKKPTLASGTTPTDGTTTTTPPTTGTGTTVTQTTDPVTGLPIKPVVKTLSSDDMLAIQNLRDTILSSIGKKNSYKKASSRANVQAEIDKDMAKLKAYGYALDNQNKLIKISE
jgi:hypothetical protein